MFINQRGYHLLRRGPFPGLEPLEEVGSYGNNVEHCQEAQARKNNRLDWNHNAFAPRWLINTYGFAHAILHMRSLSHSACCTYYTGAIWYYSYHQAEYADSISPEPELPWIMVLSDRVGALCAADRHFQLLCRWLNHQPQP